MMRINISRDHFYEVLNIHEGVFSPLEGFMNLKDVESICSPDVCLADGQFFPVPILLDINEEIARSVNKVDRVDLFYDDQKICSLEVEDIFEPDKEEIAKKIFKTTSLEHPGVAYLNASQKKCLGGKLTDYEEYPLKKNYLTPMQTKALFKQKGWSTIAGFQTRNVPHLAHEYLQRLALEQVDGLMIQPLVGWKKEGDYTQEAIEASYKVLIEDFYPSKKVLFNLLYTPMRYAGPREALLHSLIRRNFGCTHFIVGRDHAGVKNFYDTYEAQKLALQLQDTIGIKILDIQEPYYCNKCLAIVTSRNCGHSSDYSKREDISGTMIRSMILSEEKMDNKYIRKEILESIKDIQVFIN